MKQSLRTKNRIREHNDHGWRQTENRSDRMKDHVLFICPCGWVGWLPEGEIGLDPA